MTKAFLTSAAIFGLIAIGQAAPTRAETLTGNSKGFSSRPLTPSAMRPLLSSFHFRFSNEDHHFGGMEAAPDSFQARKLQFGYSDKNGDDPYTYELSVSRYPYEIRGYETEREFCHGRNCRFNIKRPTDLSDPVFVIVGFYIQYRGGDHHLRKIGISENNGFVTVNLYDQNWDDDYSLDLKYAYVPKLRTSAVSSAWGTAVRVAHSTIPVGKVALRGFEMELVPAGDRHIKELGVVANGNGRLDVYFGDKEPTERFKWRVDYAILR